ncbi:hypothetical protein [Ruminococcus flavefaciens]|uniref:hypothetical protein n=1 Tax=Ruminococcus flavefaciens TaxID=1265 RepID=UPI0026EF801D|nr:hypothetical protein [Ruminococcus flavefaciens]
MKKNIKNVLRSSDDKTLERIAERGNAADNETASRIYNKCLTRMDKDSAQTEMYTAEPVRRAPRFAPAFIAAACAIIVIGAVGVAKKFKAPAPKPVDTAPVIAATGTTVSATDDEHRIVDTTETKAVTVSAANTKAAETAVTTVTVKNELWKSTVPAVGAFINTTNTTAGAPKTTARTTAKTTKAASKTITANTVTTAKSGEKHMTLAEIEEWERKNVPSTLVRERAILNGKISANSPRVTLAQIKQIISESSSTDEIYKKIQNIQPYPDVEGGSGFTLIEYWVNGNSDNYVLLSPDGKGVQLMDRVSRKVTEVLYTEPRVTTPPVTNKPEYAGEITIDEVLKLAKNSNDIQFSDFKKYCSSPDYYDTSYMKFRISDREDWYLKVSANNGGSGVICGIGDNIGHYRMDILTTPYDEVLKNIHDWTYKDDVITAPIAGKISIDDVIRIHQEKGENLDPSDFADFNDDSFRLNDSQIVKYRVTDGDKYKVSKVNEVYLTLLLGSGRPLLDASLHDQNFIYKSHLINSLDEFEYRGTFINSIDGELEDTKFGAWFLDNQ